MKNKTFKTMTLRSLRFLRFLRFSSVLDLLVFWGLQGRLQPSPDLVPGRQSLVFFEIFEIFEISWLRLSILLLFTVIRQCDNQKHMVKVLHWTRTSNGSITFGSKSLKRHSKMTLLCPCPQVGPGGDHGMGRAPGPPPPKHR